MYDLFLYTAEWKNGQWVLKEIHDFDNRGVGINYCPSHEWYAIMKDKKDPRQLDLVEEIDKAADGQFQPKLSDPSDKTSSPNHRSGYGAIIYDGVTYTTLDWIIRNASLGHSLAGGEGKILVGEINRLKEKLKNG